MTRGGYREKAGRKSTWVSGCKFEQTKLIRVPIAISDRVLEIALYPFNLKMRSRFLP